MEGDVGSMKGDVARGESILGLGGHRVAREFQSRGRHDHYRRRPWRSWRPRIMCVRGVSPTSEWYRDKSVWRCTFYSPQHMYGRNTNRELQHHRVSCTVARFMLFLPNVRAPPVAHAVTRSGGPLYASTAAFNCFTNALHVVLHSALGTFAQSLCWHVPCAATMAERISARLFWHFGSGAMQLPAASSIGLSTLPTAAHA